MKPETIGTLALVAVAFAFLALDLPTFAFLFGLAALGSAFIILLDP